MVKQLIEGQIAAIDFIATNPDEGRGALASGIEKATSKPIAPELVTASFTNLTFTLDPIASSLKKAAKDADASASSTRSTSRGSTTLMILNEVLKKAASRPSKDDALGGP